jgi:phage baseplate assembly protein W
MTTWSTARPVRRDARGYVATAEGAASIVGCVQTILDTSPGESEFEPPFGSRLPKLVHEPNDAALESEMAHETAEAIGRHEPRVSVANATFVREDRRTTADVELRARGSRTSLSAPARVTFGSR